MVADEEFDSVMPIPVPQDLKLWLEKADRAHGAHGAICANEASIRYKLNLLLVCAHDLAYSPIKWEGKIRTLWGRPDYGIWYGEKEDLDLNAVIMEAKRPNAGGDEIPQALAYMGCVHKQRKNLGKTDTTVYGISTDAMNFMFMKLDNESRWSFKPVGVVGNGFEQVLGLLVYMMKKATSMSSAASKRTSHRTQQGSGESDLSFDYNPEMDDEMDVE
ncbi:hypothetical protein VN97_g3266 [Penicillium thymicola]|uniref:Uncharacterized protein n=1 Tax=Penicillium thymicola TaxID=293382 RepID=A0AAI9TMP0_PENTH|nr:hypothetical protein VN97_g3266 [Penicillium thymicola]